MNTEKNNTQTNDIPTQTNLNSVINALNENASATKKLFDTVVKSIHSISDSVSKKEAKGVNNDLDNIEKIEKMVVSYNNIVANIISVLCQDKNGNSLKLHELLGVMKDESKSTNDKIVEKYAVIDAAIQIPKVIDSMFELFDKISEHKFNLKSLINFKLNMLKIKSMIDNMYSSMIDIFSSVETNVQMDKIIKLLVKEPEIIVKEEHNDQLDKFVKKEFNKTKTKQGKPGILDVFSKTFETINVLNTLEAPNIIKLTFEIRKITMSLGIVFNQLLKFCNTYVTGENKKMLQKFEATLLGSIDKNGNREGGISGIISGINNLLKTLQTQNFNIVKLLMLILKLKVVGLVFDAVLQLINHIEPLNDEGYMKTLDNVNKLLKTKLEPIFKSVTVLGVLAVPFILSSLLLSISIWAFVGLLWVLSKAINVISKIIQNSQIDVALETLESVFKSLGKIMLIVCVIGLLVIPATIALLGLLVFSIVLGLVLVGLWGISWLVSKIAENVKTGFDGVLDLLIVIAYICIFIVLTALIMPLTVKSLISIVIVITAIFTAMTAIWLISLALDKITIAAKENVIKFAFSITVMTLVFALVGLTLLMFAAISPLILDAFTKNLAGFIVGLVLSMGIVWLLAKMLNKFSQKASVESVKFAIAIAILCGAFMLAGMIVLEAAFVGKQLNSWDTWGHIALGIAGMIVISLAMIGLGIALSAGATFIGWAAVGMGSLMILLALFAGVGLAVLAISKMNFELGSYKEGTKETNYIGTGTGAIGNVCIIKDFIKLLLDKLILTREDKKQARIARKTVKQVKKTVGYMVEIANSLMEIQDINLDTTLIISKVRSIFDFITALNVEIEGFLNPDEENKTSLTPEPGLFSKMFGGTKAGATKRAYKKANKMLNKVQKVITTLADIGNAINSILDLKLDDSTKGTITGNLDKIFEFIGSLDGHIKELMRPEEVTETGAVGLLKRIHRRVQKIEDDRNFDNADEKMSKMESVILSIQNIGEAFNTLKDLEFTETVGDVKGTKDKIIGNVNIIIATLKDIAKTISDESAALLIEDDYEYTIEGLNSLIEFINKSNEAFKQIESIDNAIIEQNISSYIKFFEKTGEIDTENITKSVGIIQQIESALVNISSALSNSKNAISVTSDNVNDIKNYLNLLNDNIKLESDLLTSINTVIPTINTTIDEINSLGTSNFDTEKLNDKIDIISRLNKEIIKFGSVKATHVRQTKDMISSHTEFLDKIQTVDLSKLNVSANMIESMAKLSKSIRGNFEGLAESINEDLMPVLEELKKIMETIPEKLEVGFQNTSASIGAAQAPQTTANVTAQVKRENPNLTVDQVNNIVDQRLKERASEQAGNKTISDIYNLLAGMSSNKAKVKLL